eukprot:645554-Pleurochrysis_carterae.AAC.1
MPSAPVTELFAMRTFGGPSAEEDPESKASEGDATILTTAASRVSTGSYVWLQIVVIAANYTLDSAWSNGRADHT